MEQQPKVRACSRAYCASVVTRPRLCHGSSIMMPSSAVLGSVVRTRLVVAMSRCGIVLWVGDPCEAQVGAGQVMELAPAQGTPSGLAAREARLERAAVVQRVHRVEVIERSGTGDGAGPGVRQAGAMGCGGHRSGGGHSGPRLGVREGGGRARCRSAATADSRCGATDRVSSPSVAASSPVTGFLPLEGSHSRAGPAGAGGCRP